MGFTGRPLERVCTTELGQGAHARKMWFLLEVLYLGITSLYAKNLKTMVQECYTALRRTPIKYIQIPSSVVNVVSNALQRTCRGGGQETPSESITGGVCYVRHECSIGRPSRS